jgi:hypothetical protein
MMLLLLGAAMLAAFGCEASDPSTSADLSPVTPGRGNTASASDEELTVSIHLPKTRFVSGESLSLTIVATNRSDKGIRLRGTTTAPYLVRIARLGAVGWRKVRVYPEAAAPVLSEWVIPPGGSRTFKTVLTVEPDWPTYENLRLETHLAGRESVRPFVHFEITPGGEP